MNSFLLNLVLALIWMALTGQFTAASLGSGLVLGFLVLFFTRRIMGTSTYGSRLVRVVSLILFFIRELIIANFRVAIEVLSPRLRIRPGVFTVPLDVETDAEITLLANLVTITPGSLILDVSPDRRELYVHAMNADDLEQVRKQIKDGFERRIMQVMR